MCYVLLWYLRESTELNAKRLCRWNKCDSLCILVLWLVLLGLISFFVLWVDRPFSEYIAAYPAMTNSLALKTLSLFGKNIIIAALLCLIYLACFLRKATAKTFVQLHYVILCFLSANLITFCLKMLLGRARPTEWLINKNYGFYGPYFQDNFWSHPSGHAVSVMSICFALSFLKPRYIWVYVPLSCILIATRVLLLKHYLSDVMAATLLAFTVCYVLYKVGRIKEKMQLQ